MNGWIAAAVFVAAVIPLVAWLIYEVRADRKWQDSIKPTVPGPRERLPPQSDV